MSPFFLRLGEKVLFEGRKATVEAVYMIPFFGLAYVVFDDTEKRGFYRTRDLTRAPK